MTRRRSRWKVWKTTGLLLLLAIVVFMGVLPLIEILIPWDPIWSWRLESIRVALMQVIIAIWFFAFGSMVGSFINVVVWRMPRGVSVVTRGSACPHCRARIRLADNVPIIGWLKLGGRCRVCHLPISPRYPIVEAIFGGLYLLIFLIELSSAGGNLPNGPWHYPAGILPVVVTNQWDVIGVYAFHMTLISVLLTWTLMQFDGSRIPGKTIGFALLAGFVAPAIFPMLQPVKWMEGSDQWLSGLVVIHRIATGFAGLSVGFLVGEFIDLLENRNGDLPSPGYFRNGMMTTGLFLGWQALCGVTLIAGTLMIGAASIRGVPFSRVWPATGWLCAATVIWISAWRWIDIMAGAGLTASLLYSGCLAIGVILIAISIRLLHQTCDSLPSDSGQKGQVNA